MYYQFSDTSRTGASATRYPAISTCHPSCAPTAVLRHFFSNSLPRQGPTLARNPCRPNVQRRILGGLVYRSNNLTTRGAARLQAAGHLRRLGKAYAESKRVSDKQRPLFSSVLVLREGSSWKQRLDSPAGYAREFRSLVGSSNRRKRLAAQPVFFGGTQDEKTAAVA